MNFLAKNRRLISCDVLDVFEERAKESDLLTMVVLTNRIVNIDQGKVSPMNVWINIVRSIVDILEKQNM